MHRAIKQVFPCANPNKEVKTMHAHDEQKKEIAVIVNEDGEEKEYEVLMRFTLDQNGNRYIIVMPVGEDEHIDEDEDIDDEDVDDEEFFDDEDEEYEDIDEEVVHDVFAFRYEQIGEEVFMSHIESDEEFGMVQEAFEERINAKNDALEITLDHLKQ
jgi:uncharacterized protein YrzB (UPF0473 family)